MMLFPKVRSFLDGSVVKNSPSNVGDMGSIPDPGRSHMPQNKSVHVLQLLSLYSTTREAIAMRSPCPTAREEPLLATPREKPAQQQRLSTDINKIIFKKPGCKIAHTHKLNYINTLCTEKKYIASSVCFYTVKLQDKFYFYEYFFHIL